MPSSEADLLVDRRRLKRQVSLWRLAAIVIALVAILGAAAHLGRPFWGTGHIGRFSISGVITDDPQRLVALREAAEDRHLAALLVRIDSPGGTVVASEELHRQLRDIAVRIPVVAVLGQTAASGGYMVALGADRIFAREGTITGSIGVLMQTADVSGLLRKLGVSMEQIRSVPLKAVPNPLEPLTDEGRRAPSRRWPGLYRAPGPDARPRRRTRRRGRGACLADEHARRFRRIAGPRYQAPLPGRARARHRRLHHCHPARKTLSAGTTYH